MFCKECGNFLEIKIENNRLYYICSECNGYKQVHENGEVYLSIPIIHNSNSTSDSDSEYMKRVKEMGYNVKINKQ